MANLLAHALAAMAFCGLLNLVFGMPSVSWGLFAAGFLAMLIELDVDDLSDNNRSPFGHSVFFGVIWIVVFSAVIWGIFPGEIALRGTIVVVAAYSTHLFIDMFTKEGIYVFPKDSKIKNWITRLSKGSSKTWECWHLFQNNRIKKLSRKNDDPVLNAVISIPSLMIIIVFVALMPVPL